MSWIDEADLPDLPDIFRALSLNSAGLNAVQELNESLAFGNSTLTRVQEEAVATVVSVANRCRYGALTHGGFFRRYSGDSDLASQLLADYTQADLSQKDRRMLDFAVRVTLEPSSLNESDIDGLRAVGFQEQDIVSVVLITCLFNFMNRVASCLGVEVPSNFQRAAQGWLSGPAAQGAWMFSGWPKPAQSQAGIASIGLALRREEHLQSTEIVGEASPEAVPATNNNTMAAEPKEDKHIQRFVEDCCAVSPEDACTARDLYIAYLRWCDENRRGPMVQRNFGLGLTQMGFRRRRRGQGRHWWLGLCPKPNDSNALHGAAAAG